MIRILNLLELLWQSTLDLNSFAFDIGLRIIGIGDLSFAIEGNFPLEHQ